MWLLIIHVFLSLALGLMGRKRLSLEERLCNVGLALFLPVAGAAVAIYLFAHRSHDPTAELEDDEMAQITLFTDRVNIETETNILSMEEILMVDDKKTKRKQFLNTLKDDITEYIDKLQMALRDEDIETSHYAASAISEIQKSLDLKIQQMASAVERDPGDLIAAGAYLDVIWEYLDSGLADERSKARLLQESLRLLELLMQQGHRNQKDYKRFIETNMELGDEKKAMSGCEAYLEAYETEAAFVTALQCYYKLRDRAKFYVTLSALKQSDIVLSKDGLEIVRVWNVGD